MNEASRLDDSTGEKSPRYGALEGFFSLEVLRDFWEISPDENDLLWIPEYRLPRMQRLLNRMRLVVLLAAIVRVLFFVMAGGQYALLLAELVIGMIALGVTTLLITRAHARDVQSLDLLGAVQSNPDGSPKLAQALFLRPFGEILHLIAHYYAFVIWALLIDTTVIVYLMGPLHDQIDLVAGCMMIVVLLHFPGICLVLAMIMSSIDRGVRHETIQSGRAPWARFWEYSYACLHFDSLLFVWVWLSVGVVFAGHLHRSLLVILPVTLLIFSFLLIYGLGRKFIRWRFERIAIALCRDLDEHWQR